MLESELSLVEMLLDVADVLLAGGHDHHAVVETPHDTSDLVAVVINRSGCDDRGHDWVLWNLTEFAGHDTVELSVGGWRASQDTHTRSLSARED